MAENTEREWQQDPEWKAILAKASAPSQTLRGDVDVFTYQSSHDPYFTSSYYFETERGVVLVDSQLFYSSVKELWEQIQENTSGDLRYVVNTHAHPDHYWGNTYLSKVAPKAVFITGSDTYDDMLATVAARVAKTSNEWPADEVFSDPGRIVLPSVVFDGTLTLRFEQITLELGEYGPAEAPVQVIGWIPEHGALITADVVQNMQHLYFSDRTLASWYTILEDFEELEPQHVLTGHQGIAGPGILNETKRWISVYLGLMAAALPPGEDPENIDALTQDERRKLVADLKAALPGWFDPYFYQGETVLEQCIAGARSEIVGAQLLGS